MLSAWFPDVPHTRIHLDEGLQLEAWLEVLAFTVCPRRKGLIDLVKIDVEQAIVSLHPFSSPTDVVGEHGNGIPQWKENILIGREVFVNKSDVGRDGFFFGIADEGTNQY